MRKRIIGGKPAEVPTAGRNWLPLDELATVEVTSENPAHPVEAALGPVPERGWRAADTGEQILRLIFETPQTLRHVRLLFQEEERDRTQEFILRWTDAGGEYREIVRQQYNFSPPETTLEVENYRVELEGVTVLELKIVPDIGGGTARASLRHLQVA